MRLKKNGNTYYREVNLKISRNMIAKEAGVTPTTVSCVLNNTRPVSAKVRAKVMAAIEKLNYVPDLAARAMLGKGSKQIFVMVDSIKNPFFAELVYSMEEAGIQKGYFFSICGKMDMKTYVAHIIARKIDAVYFCSEIKNEEAVYVSQLLEDGIRILTSPKFKHFEGQISRIDMATGEAARSAVRLLTAKGHTKIGFLNTFSDETQDDRLPLFREEMLKNGLTPRCVPPDRTCFAGLESGRTLFRALMEAYPDTTAVLGINDLVAIGAMNEAQRMGYRVPEDLSFVGIDGIELSSLVTPRLTTYRSNASELGKKAFEMLCQLIETGEISSYTHSLTLQEGESVRDLKHV